MPTRALSICPVPSCHALTRGGRCPAHKRQSWRAYETRRPDRSEIKAFYASSGWQKARAAKLEADPSCEDCAAFGYQRAASQVDHITPVREGGDPHDATNLRSLCLPCHSRRTMAANRKAGKL
jgi:5-methylcytosine-specific restriction enzyme A